MGTVLATIQVAHHHEPQTFQPLEVEVDTGCTYTAVPRQMLEALGVPVTRVERSKLADGGIKPLDVGDAAIRLAGKEFITTVSFADEGEPSLLGVITLEQALMAVDPVNGELIPVAARA